MRNRLWMGTFAIGVVGCAQMVTIEPDPDSRYYMPPVGTVVRIHEKLTVPPGWARVFLQRGEAVSYSHMDLYYPSCNFELYTVADRPQSIQPGSFTMIHVARRDEEVAGVGFIRYASLWLVADSGVDSGGPSMIMRTVRMKLESDEQPGMYMLTCRGALDNPPDAREISINEMRFALGDKATILLPEEH